MTRPFEIVARLRLRYILRTNVILVLLLISTTSCIAQTSIKFSDGSCSVDRPEYPAVETCSPESDIELNWYATGNMAPRYPYHAMKMYYYDRPYNAGQLTPQFSFVEGSVDHLNMPYSNRIFEGIFDRFEQQGIYHRLGQSSQDLNEADEFNPVAKDKYFEFSDWDVHRESRLNWQRSKNMQSQTHVSPKDDVDRNVSKRQTYYD